MRFEGRPLVRTDRSWSWQRGEAWGHPLHQSWDRCTRSIADYSANPRYNAVIARDRPQSPQALEAAQLLGELIGIARRERRWTQQDLAERIGVTPRTLAKVEAGDPNVRLGTAFEAAALLGIPLFHPDRSLLSVELDRARAQGALLPARIRTRRGEVKDDF